MAKGRSHNIRENLLLALDTLRTHKFRAFLTILGVLIGTMTVISVASIFKGLDQQMVETLEGFGTRTLVHLQVRAGNHISPDARGAAAQAPDLRAGHGHPGKLPLGGIGGGGRLHLGASGRGEVQGAGNGRHATSRAPRRKTSATSTPNLKDGRLYTRIDDLHRADVAVIGADVVERFFPGEDPIGKEIQVDGHTFQVIGTLEKRKAFLGDNGNDRIVFVPYFTYKKLYPNSKENFITALAYPGKLDQAKDEITGMLRRLRNDKPSDPNSFGIATAESIITQFRDMMGMVVLVTMVISSIGLMVGGIGVMNIMLVSVTERTREIGVRKAIGARRSDITWQFLLEAMTLTGTGGLLGILGSITLSYVVRAVGWPSAIPAWAVVLGFVASVSIGLFFGMWPAMKASRLDPIVALRHE